MKRIFITLTLFFSMLSVAFAQAPQKFTYQAVVRDAGNVLVASQAVGVRISILQGGANGTMVYQETHTAVTNANGLMTLQIGGGTVMNGDFAAIDWATGPYFLKIETDPTGGTNYTIEGTQQLLSVPYALYAGNAANSFSGSYNDLTDTPDIPQIPENVSVFNNDAGYITMDSIPEIPIVPTNVSAFANDVGYITMDSIPEIPTVPTNVSAFVNDAGYVTESTLTTENYITQNDLITNNYVTEADIPTNVSAFTNDAGYLTSVDCGNINICDLFAELQAQIEDLQHTVDSLSEHGGEEEETPVGALPCPGTPTVTDIDGNVYNTVRIGNQCWMKENLRTTHYADNTAIPAGSTTSFTEPYRYTPNNDESNVETYGYLYNWAAVMHGESSSYVIPSGVQGICPTGWHVPSDAEWTQLADYVNSQIQYVCGGDNTHIAGNIAKALAGTTGWNSSAITCAVGNTPSGNNGSGFSALPAGDYGGGDYYNVGNYANFWSATEESGSLAWFLGLYYYGADVDLDYNGKSSGKSVRCVRD